MKYKKGRYLEWFTVAKQGIVFRVGCFVKEGVRRANGDDNGSNYQNEYVFSCKKLFYIPELGDILYYDFIGGESVIGRSLVVKAIEYNPTEDYVVFYCTFKDFIASDAVLSAYNMNIYRRTFSLVNVSDGHHVSHLDVSLIPDAQILLMAHFYYPDGSIATEINYEQFDNNTIQLNMFPGTTFTGTVTIERR